jgi:hypothetical protein
MQNTAEAIQLNREDRQAQDWASLNRLASA